MLVGVVIQLGVIKHDGLLENIRGLNGQLGISSKPWSWG